MHAVKSALLIAGLVFVSSACSSGLDDPQTLSATSAFDAKFKVYAKTDKDSITAQDLVDAEEPIQASTIKDLAAATELLNSVDMNGDEKIDKVEFTALIERNVLVGIKK